MATLLGRALHSSWHDCTRLGKMTAVLLLRGEEGHERCKDPHVAGGDLGLNRGRQGEHPVAAWLDGPCALQPPAPACNAAPAKLFRPVSRACTGGIFALKTGS